MNDQENKNINSFVAWGILFIAFMVLVTYFYFNFASPNNNKDHLSNFFWIFPQEIIAAIFVIVALLAVFIVKIVKYLNHKKGEK